MLVGPVPAAYVLHFARNVGIIKKTVVDSVGLSAHIVFPGIAAAFAAATGFFFATKSSAYFGTAGAYVYIGNAAVASVQIKMLRLRACCWS
jgi:hypothetical protein